MMHLPRIVLAKNGGAEKDACEALRVWRGMPRECHANNKNNFDAK